VVGGDGFDLPGDVFQFYRLGAVSLGGNHDAILALIDQVGAGGSQPGGQQTVGRGGDAAALQVPEDGDAGFQPGQQFELFGETHRFFCVLGFRDVFCLGFLAGLTGVGGGIFLSPLLLLFRLAEIRVISGIAAAFILVNSVAGLLGVITTSPELPAALPYWAVAAVAGGLVGAEYGSKRLGNPAIKKLLAVVLLIAGAKMIAMP